MNKTDRTSNNIVLRFSIKNTRSINIPTETKNKATNTIRKECKLVLTQLVSLAEETITPATNAPNADDRLRKAVSKEKPKQKVKAMKTCIS